MKTKGEGGVTVCISLGGDVREWRGRVETMSKCAVRDIYTIAWQVLRR